MDYTTPNVYVVEQDQSLYTRGQATSVAGIVGVASRGPIGKAVLTSSLQSFQEVFGSPRLDSDFYQGAKDYFDHGGTALYAVRTAHYADITNPASITAQRPVAEVPSATLGTPALRFELDHGVAGNGLRLEVVLNDNDTLDVFVRDAAGNLLEGHRSLYSGLENIREDRYVERYFPRASLLNLRCEDLGVAPVEATGENAVVFAGGDDGLGELDDLDYIGSGSAKNGLSALDEIGNLRLLAVPGIASPAVIQAGIAYAERRQDLLFITGTPQSLTPQEAIEFRRGKGVFTHTAFDSTYGAMYYPWLIKLDEATRTQRALPPEGTVLGVIANSDLQAAPWAAPAGKTRGQVLNALDTEYKVDDVANGELYANGINVIRSFPNGGIVVWGQKTLSSKPSAFDRINVRRLFIYLEQAMKDTSEYMLFEPNNPGTWEAFKRFARPILQEVQDQGGIFVQGTEPGFVVMCDDSTNTQTYLERNIMRAKIFIRPTKTAEYIRLEFTATGQESVLNVLAEAA